MTRHAEELAASRMFLVEDDVRLLKRIGRKLPAGDCSVIDIGAGAGTTALAILEASKDAYVRMIDISPTELSYAREAIRNVGFAARAEAHVISSLDAARSWGGQHKGNVLVLLDASHTYEATKAELEAWVPSIKPGGWLWCHDYLGDGGLPEGENGVKRAVDEYVEEHATLFVERDQMGLGIALRVKP